MEHGAPLSLRSYFKTFVSEPDIAATKAESLNNFIYLLFTIKYNVKFLENMSLRSACTKGRTVHELKKG